MTIKARIYDGAHITNISPPGCHSQYDGVFVQIIGTTFQNDQWQRAGMTLEMSYKDALDMALALFDAAAKHADESVKALPKYAKRIQRLVDKKKKNRATPLTKMDQS